MKPDLTTPSGLTTADLRGVKIVRLVLLSLVAGPTPRFRSTNNVALEGGFRFGGRFKI